MKKRRLWLTGTVLCSLLLLVAVNPVKRSIAEGLFRHAQNLYNQGNYEEAVQALERGIRLVPADGGTCSVLADAYFILGRYEDAVEAYNKCVEVCPDDYRAHMMLGDIHHIEGRNGDAVGAYTRAAALKPDDANIQLSLGNVYKDANQPLEAIRFYGIAIELDPNFLDAHLQRGYVYDDLGNYDGAILSFQDVVRLKPDYVWGHVGLGSAYYYAGKLEQAIEEFKECIRLEPGVSDPHMWIGRAYTQLGRHNEAIESSNRALELPPNNPATIPQAHLTLGVGYFEIGSVDLALKEHAILRQLDSKLADWLLGFMETDGYRRDLSTPSGRLAGHWRSTGGREIIYSAPDPSLGIGTYEIRSTSQNSVFRFKVVEEEVSGTSLIIRNFNDVWAAQMKIATGVDLSQSDVSCSISKDGQRMTQECTFGSVRSLHVYEYVPACGGAMSQTALQTDLTPDHGSQIPSATSGLQPDAIGIAPDGRFYALIGGAFVYKGSIVQGYRVQTIRPDSVEFERDGEVWVQKIQ